MSENGLMPAMRKNLECFEVRSVRRVSVPCVPRKEYEKLKRQNEKLRREKEEWYTMAISMGCTLTTMIVMLWLFV